MIQIRHVKAYESAVAKAALGEADWGRFIERYGIPPVHTVMPPGVTEEQKKDFQSATDDAKDGLCTTWPSGTSLSFAESARGVNPFAPFIEHCQKEILILATGGTLATLAEAGAGTLAGAFEKTLMLGKVEGRRRRGRSSVHGVFQARVLDRVPLPSPGVC